MRRCAVGGLGAGAGLALLLVGPHPDDLPAGAGDLGRWIATDPEHALVTAVGLVAWVCLLWLCAGGALAALSALPGTVGRLAGRLARLLLPRLARRLVEVAVGVSLAAGSVGTAVPALASGAGLPVPVTAPPAGLPLGHAWPDLDRPVTGARVVRPGPAPSPVLAPPAPAPASVPPAGPTHGPAVTTGATAPAGPGATGPPATSRTPDGAPSASRYPPRSPDRPRPPWPDLDRPLPGDRRSMAGPLRHVPDPEPHGPEPHGPEVVVHRGDTLWTIAARHLGPGTTDERVAEEWPRWYAANRDVVGADPDLIRPGQRLRPPPAGPDRSPAQSRGGPMTVPDPRPPLVPVVGPPGSSGPCRLPLRSAEPPHDDDPQASAPPPAPSTQGTLALVLPDAAPVRLAWPPQIPAPRRFAGARLRLVPSPSAVPSGDHLSAGPAARVVVQALVEVLSGTRAPAQLAGWTTPRLQMDLERRVGRPGPRLRCVARSMRVSEPSPGVAEVSAVIRRGDRMAALALRMEAQGSRWRVTTLQVG